MGCFGLLFWTFRCAALWRCGRTQAQATSLERAKLLAEKECLISVVGTAPVGRIWVWATYGNFSFFRLKLYGFEGKKIVFQEIFWVPFFALLWWTVEVHSCEDWKFHDNQIGVPEIYIFFSWKDNTDFVFKFPRPVFSTRFPKGRKSSIEVPGFVFKTVMILTNPRDSREIFRTEPCYTQVN